MSEKHTINACIKGNFGSKIFYSTCLTFEEIAFWICKGVVKVNPDASCLEKGFNPREDENEVFPLIKVLCYGDTPEWIREKEDSNFGRLEFSGNEKMFVNEGGYYVEKIRQLMNFKKKKEKEANNDIKDFQLPVTFILSKEAAPY